MFKVVYCSAIFIKYICNIKIIRFVGLHSNAVRIHPTRSTLLKTVCENETYFYLDLQCVLATLFKSPILKKSFRFI